MGNSTIKNKLRFRVVRFLYRILLHIAIYLNKDSQNFKNLYLELVLYKNVDKYTNKNKNCG